MLDFFFSKNHNSIKFKINFIIQKISFKTFNLILLKLIHELKNELN